MYNVYLIGFAEEEEGEDSAPLMVLEFMQYGDLAAFLKMHRQAIVISCIVSSKSYFHC